MVVLIVVLILYCQVSKNSTVRKNDYNIVTNTKDSETVDFDQNSRHERAHSGREISTW